jgi:hypothetical protein
LNLIWPIDQYMGAIRGYGKNMDAAYSGRLISRGRAYGLLASAMLIGYFVCPPIAELAARACDGGLICPAKVERGVYEVFAVATAISFIAGFLASREIDKDRTSRQVTASTIFAVHTAFFGGVIWVMLHAAFR